ncbi:MAG: patatin family protein [Lachnospiraceae bacterium]|nr:patatin family protein [Lachnospiraceae bacterium]
MKTGLIVEGGGMKCAYSAGVLDVLLDHDINFDYCIGVSAGAANAASFLAGQRERNMRFYTKHVKDPNYISVRSLVRTGSLFGLQYIYGDMTNEGGIDPLDYDAYINNPTEAYMPATDALTGKPHYFNKNDIRRNEYQPIMATCALPVACKPIEYEGHIYYDGGVSDSIPIMHALHHGCDRIVVIFSKPKGFRMKPQGGRVAYTAALRRKYPKIVKDLNHRHEKYNAQMDMVESLQAKGQVYCFNPRADIEIGTYTTEPAVMMKLYDNGVEDATQNINRLKDFLNGK